MRWSTAVGIAHVIVVAGALAPTVIAQYEELTTRSELLDWPPKQPARIMTAGCLVGTNGWASEGQFTQNTSNTWWFSEANLVERTVIDKLIPEPDRSRPSTPGFLAVGVPSVGQRFTHIYESARQRKKDGNSLCISSSQTWPPSPLFKPGKHGSPRSNANCKPSVPCGREV